MWIFETVNSARGADVYNIQACIFLINVHTSFKQEDVSVSNNDAKPWSVFDRRSLIYTTVTLLPVMIVQFWWACTRLPTENGPRSVYLWRLGCLPLVFVFCSESASQVFGLALTGQSILSKRQRVSLVSLARCMELLLHVYIQTME